MTIKAFDICHSNSSLKTNTFQNFEETQE